MSTETKSYISSSSLLSRTTTSHTTYDQSLSSFAPELLKHILCREYNNDNKANGISPPYVKTFEAVGFFADVSGFTKATESLSNAMGDLGTEILAHKINAYLPHIAKKIVGSGGDVVKFAGDALLCIWPPPPDTIYNEYQYEFFKLEKIWRKYQNHKIDNNDINKLLKYNKFCNKFNRIKSLYLNKKYENEKQQKEYSRKNSFAAIQCAIEIQQKFGSMILSGSYHNKHHNKHHHNKYNKYKYSKYNNNYKQNVKQRRRAKKNNNEKIEFRVKLGIGIGKIHLLIVGGNLGRCEYLICGDGLIQAFDCENDCDPKENRMIVISEQVSKIDGIRDNFLLKKVINTDNNNNNNINLNNFQVISINKKCQHRTKIERKHYGHLIPDISNGLTVKLTAYVPAAVKPHLLQPQQIWTGELRLVTILFVSLPWNARSFAKFTHNILIKLQSIIFTLQSVIYKYQGSLNKFLIDDKGSTVMCVFGLPPVAHQNDPARAVLAALELREKIRNKKQPAAIGISCGTVFVGIIGSKGVRREYGILGDKVNLSARLMSLSKKNPVKLGEVVVDDTVYQRSKKEVRIEWTDLGWVWVKGKMDKVHIWRPARNNIPISAHKIGQAVYLETSDKISLKNINKEIDIFLHSNKQKQKQRDGRIILIQGEIGIGKTSLLGQIQVRNNKSMWFLWGKADQFHECYDVNYIVWKQILLGFTSRYSLMTNKNRYLFQTYVNQRRPDLIKWLFLINDLIDLGNYKLLETQFLPITYSMDNKNKYDSTKQYKLDKYRHDLIFVLLEWTARIKPIAIIIDEIQYLTKKDWQITRRLCCLVKNKILKNVMIFLGCTPIDNQRYRPLFKSQKMIDNFTDIRLNYTHRVIEPSPWGYNKTKFFVKKYFDIGDCAQRVVMTVHSQCGGRPGFCEHFLSELTNDINHIQYIQVFHGGKKNKGNKGNDLKKQRQSHIYQQHQYFNNHYKNKHMAINNVNRNEMYGTFDPELDERFKIGLDVSFPIPSYIQSITSSHIDKLNVEQIFVLKIASVICKSKGNNSIQFEEHMIRGCHPLAETGMNSKKRLRNAFNELCEMKFIYKINNNRDDCNNREKQKHFDDISIDLDNDTNFNFKPNKTVKLTKIPSYNKFDEIEEDNKNNKNNMDMHHIDYTEFDGITDPMPATKALLQKPSKSVPYKKGKMFKRGVNFINMTETQRTFVFKHRTLYWIKDENEEYPRSRIKFDQSVQKLKREDMRSVSISTPRKEYILRCQEKKDMDEWFKLFTEAVRANYLSDSLMKRMKQHTTKTNTRNNNKKKEIMNGHHGVTQKKRNSRKYNKRNIDKYNNKNNIKSYGLKLDSNSKKNIDDYLRGSVVDVEYGAASRKQENKFESARQRISKMNKKYNNNNNKNDDKDLNQFDDYIGSYTEPPNNNNNNNNKRRMVRFDEDEEEWNSDEMEHDVINVLKEEFIDSDDDDDDLSNIALDKKISSQLRVAISVDLISSDEEYDLVGIQSGDSMYEFSYGFLRDIIYEQMLNNQRKQLHTNALKYIAKCLEEKNDDKLALLHTRHIECVQRYSDMLQGDDSQKTAFQPKRPSFFARKAK